MSMKNLTKNKSGGFIELIVLIILAIFLLNYFHLTISGAWNWLVTAVHNVFH